MAHRAKTRFPWRPAGGGHPAPQTVRPSLSTSSQEELRNLIKTEVASLLAPSRYERLLEEAKTAIAGKDATGSAEIASLKQELAAVPVKAQAKSSAVPAAVPMSPPVCRLQTRNASRGRTNGGRCNGNSEI